MQAALYWSTVLCCWYGQHWPSSQYSLPLTASLYPPAGLVSPGSQGTPRWPHLLSHLVHTTPTHGGFQVTLGPWSCGAQRSSWRTEESSWRNEGSSWQTEGSSWQTKGSKVRQISPLSLSQYYEKCQSVNCQSHYLVSSLTNIWKCSLSNRGEIFLIFREVSLWME